MAAFALPALAQAPPDAGRILQETRPAERAPAVTLPPIEVPAPARQAVPPEAADVRVNVTYFTFTGNSALATAILEAAVAGWAGKPLNFGELIQAVEAIEARYKAAGYFLAQAYLPPQKIRDGAIEIAVTEGQLAEVRLEGESRVAAEVLYRYLDRLPKGEALRLPILERQVLLINELAGGRASLDLQAGENAGSTDVVLAQQPEDLISGRLEGNNHGAPSTGVRRFGITANANGFFNRGERISLIALASDNRGLASYNLRGELPVGGDGWRLIAGASRAEYSLGGPFASLRASGTADSIRGGVAYPILRSRAANLKIQLEADRAKLADKFQAAGTVLDKQSRGISATLSGDRMDEFLGGGSNRADLILRSGQISLGPTASAQDALGAAGRFNKATLIAQRQQTATKNVTLQAQMTAQFSSKNLDSSEKFALGGPTTIPGYANGESTGDSGVHARLAARWQALPQLALTVFTDYAQLRLANEPIAGTAKNHKRLTDTGISADWLLGKQFSASAIVAWAGKEAPNPADNDKPRIWLTLAYAW